ncbi:hypothetical protein C8Q73DRAFT_71591 [Cubamyces lactineus]|nr:hypothetical protein C8Q73DRAFT_71591 [Cubamyces lactineus]
MLCANVRLPPASTNGRARRCMKPASAFGGNTATPGALSARGRFPTRPVFHRRKHGTLYFPGPVSASEPFVAGWSDLPDSTVPTLGAPICTGSPSSGTRSTNRAVGRMGSHIDTPSIAHMSLARCSLYPSNDSTLISPVHMPPGFIFCSPRGPRPVWARCGRVSTQVINCARMPRSACDGHAGS